MRAVLLFAALGLLIVVAAVRALGSRAVVLATACIAAGAGVALAGVLAVDCAQCHTASLVVAAFASAPFWAAGLVALAISGADAWHRGWLVAIVLIGAVQAAWAAPVLYAATWGGRCPCEGFWWTQASSGLSAVGSDRWLGLLFLAEAALAVIIGWRAYRRPPRG
jgi:hypothetical protein